MSYGSALYGATQYGGASGVPNFVQDKRDDFGTIVDEQGIGLTLYKVETTQDALGGTDSVTTSSVYIDGVIQPMGWDERELSGVGDIGPGAVKGYFRHSYTDASGVEQVVDKADLVEDSQGVQWRVAAIDDVYTIQGYEIYRKCIMRRVKDAV